jgi:hypothetical protein
MLMEVLEVEVEAIPGGRVCFLLSGAKPEGKPGPRRGGGKSRGVFVLLGVGGSKRV